MPNRALRIALLVGGISAALRLTWALSAHVTQLSDFALYDKLTLDWMATGRFGNYGSYAYRTPGYPAFLAAVYTVAGHTPRAAAVVQAILGGAASGMLVLLAARFFPLPAAALAGILHMLAPTSLAYVPVLASENLAVPLLLAGMLCLAAAAEAEGGRRVGLLLGSGGLLGLLILVRPSGSLFAPAWLVLSAYSPFHRRRFLPGAILTLAAMLVVLQPWLIRNSVRGLGPVISSATAQNLWIGNNDLAQSGAWIPGVLNLQGLPERQQVSAYQRETMRWIATHRWRYLQLSWTRFVRFMGTEPDVWASAYLTPTRENDRLISAFFRTLDSGRTLPRDLQVRNEMLQGRNVRWLQAWRVLVAPLILIALGLSFLDWRRSALVVWPALCYIAGISFTFAEARFRELVDPLLFVPLAAFVWRIATCYAHHERPPRENAAPPSPGPQATAADQAPGPQG